MMYFATKPCAGPDRTFRIDKNLSLAADDFLATVVTAGSTGLRCLHGLTVDHSGSGLRFPAACRAILFAQDLIDALPFAVLTPRAEVVIDDIPGRQIVRHHAPGDAATQHIETAVDNPPQVMDALPAPPFALREKRNKKLPLLIREICWIPVGFHDCFSRNKTAPCLSNRSPCVRSRKCIRHIFSLFSNQRPLI